jgi:hypothetical protein
MADELYVCVRATRFLDGSMITDVIVEGAEAECKFAEEDEPPDMTVDRRLVMFEGFKVMTARKYLSILEEMDRLFPDEDKGIAGQQDTGTCRQHQTKHSGRIMGRQDPIMEGKPDVTAEMLKVGLEALEPYLMPQSVISSIHNDDLPDAIRAVFRAMLGAKSDT